MIPRLKLLHLLFQEVMKKYKASVSQLSVDQITIQEQANRIADMEEERNKLKEQVTMVIKFFSPSLMPRTNNLGPLPKRFIIFETHEWTQ